MEEKSNITHLLLAIWWDEIRHHNRYSSSQAVVNSDETTQQKKGVPLTSCWTSDELWWAASRTNGSATHLLLVISWNLMRLLIRKKVMSPTSYWLWNEMWQDYPTEIKSMSLTPCCSWDEILDCLENKRGSTTHKLWVMGWDVMRQKQRAVPLTP